MRRLVAPHASHGDVPTRRHSGVGWERSGAEASSVYRTVAAVGGGGNSELTLEKLTFGAGLMFILVNVVLIYQYMPRHDTHKHSHSRFDRWWRA